MGATKKDLEKMQDEELSTWESQPVQIMDKVSINQKVNHIISKVSNGEVNPLEAFVYLNFMAKIAEGAKKQLLDEALAEAEKYPEKETEVYDASVTIKNGAGRYIYPDSIKEAQEQAKLAYEAEKKGNVMTDNNGEIIEPAKYTPGRTILNIKFK